MVLLFNVVFVINGRSCNELALARGIIESRTPVPLVTNILPARRRR